MSNTTQTPTDQPTELDAIRARLKKWQTKQRNGGRRGGQCLLSLKEQMAALRQCERLLELLDERDVDRALEINAINNVLPDSEEDIAEARELMREWYDGLPAYDVAGLESLKTRTKNFIEGN